MKKLTIIVLACLGILFAVTAPAMAQGAITQTTITESATASDRQVIVASATGITAGIWLLIDNELLRVQSSYVSGTTIPVLRGPRPTTHADNSRAWIVPIGAIVERAPQGSCTRGSNEAAYTLTFIRPTGAIARCATTNGAVYPAGQFGWIVSDISGANGIQSANPPVTQ